MKIRTVNQPPLDKPSIHVMSQKEVVDNVKLLESIEEIMQPVRLEYVQLKRSLDAIQMKYDNILYEHEEDLDQTELTVENQVTLGPKSNLKSNLNFYSSRVSQDIMVPFWTYLAHWSSYYCQTTSKAAKYINH